MKTSDWSSLVVGLMLTTAASGLVRAETVGEGHRALEATLRTAPVDPAGITGSIAPAQAPIRSTLAPLTARPSTGLSDVEAARPAPARPDVAATRPATETTAPAAPAAVETPAPAPAVTTPAVTAPAASATPAPAPTAPVEAATAPATTPAPAADAASLIDAAASALPVPETIDLKAAPATATTTPATEAMPATAASTPAAAPVASPLLVTPAPAAAAAPAPAATPAAAAPATAAAPAPVSTDAAVAASLEDQLVAEAMEKAGKVAVSRAGSADERAERAALATFYRDRGWRPFFVGAQDLTPEGRRLAKAIAASDRDGLDPADYALPQSRAGTPEARAEAEFAVGETALRLVRHLASGRFAPSRVSDLVTPHPPKPKPAEVLAEFADGRDLDATIAGYAPPHEGYRRLKAELARLRGEPETPVVRLPDGPLLKPGQKDERVALLRERLGVASVASDADPETYDPALAEAVKAFQRERGLAATGKIGRSTVSALNAEAQGNADRIADVIVNMERWRWLPRDLGELHVIVNVPDFHLDVMKAGKSIHHARVITGRPENQTPIFSETMEYVVVNPYWNVPYSIVKKEMMSKLQAGRLGGSYEVEVGNRTVDPSTVDWSTVSPGNVSIRQRPGDGNALGNIKFMFPNQHSVYIHDTSSRSLFSRDYRALSHGCVRVHEPFSFADAVLSEEPETLDGSRLKKMLGRGEKTVMLKRHVPVHIVYFTEFVDDAGQVQTRRDIYGHDARMRRILGL